MVKLLNTPYNNESFEPYFSKFKHPLRDFQKHAIEGIVTDKNVLVVASTGNGKTVCCEFTFDHYISKGKKIIYTSPIKALSNQKFHDFSKLFPQQCGISTGDITFNCVSASIIIMTTEILRMILFQNGKNDMFDFADVGCIIFDEAHYINNPQRGKFWEEAIILIPQNIQLLFLSATLNAPENFANWIKTVQPSREVVIPFTLQRIVPLKHYLFTIIPPHNIKNIKDKEFQQKINANSGKLLLLKDDANKFYTNNYNLTKTLKEHIDSANIIIKPVYVLNSVAKYVKENNLLPAICFIYSRKNIEKWVTAIEHNLYEDDSKIQYTIKEECKQILMKFPNYKEYINLPEFEVITNLLQKGISYHHAGIISVFREMIEILFDKGYIKLLFATETFSIGLNLKIKTVIFSGIYKFDGTIKRILHSHEYVQGSGRAGRQGYDDVGHIIHLNNMFNLPLPVDYNQMLNGNPQTITSKFKITFNLALNLFNNNLCKMVIDKSMVNETIRAHIIELEREKEELANDLSKIAIPNDIDENKIQEIHLLKKQLVTANGNQKRKILKQLEILEKDLPADINKIFEENRLIGLINKNNFEMEQTKNILEDSITKIKIILQNGGFITETDLTEKGQIAIHLCEVHPLAFTDFIIKTNYFESLTPQQIIGILSCFASITIDENNEILIETLNKNGPIIGEIYQTVKLLQECYNNYIDEEAKHSITTDSDYELQFDLIKPVMKWAIAKTEEECKVIIQELEGIFLGEFVKALLKINNISIELGRIIDNVEFKHKMSLIPVMVLKFIATNQSLYV